MLLTAFIEKRRDVAKTRLLHLISALKSREAITYGVITPPHELMLITVAGIWIQTKFGFRICIILCNIVFGLDLNLKNLNHFSGTVSGKDSK